MALVSSYQVYSYATLTLLNNPKPTLTLTLGLGDDLVTVHGEADHDASAANREDPEHVVADVLLALHALLARRGERNGTGERGARGARANGP